MKVTVLREKRPGENRVALAESDAVSYLVTGAPSFALGAIAATLHDVLKARSGIYHPALYETPGTGPHFVFWRRVAAGSSGAASAGRTERWKRQERRRFTGAMPNRWGAISSIP